MIKAVLFDWNGVLTDSLKLDHATFLANAKMQGLEVETSMDSYRNLWNGNVFDVLWSMGFRTDEKFENAYRESYMKNIKMAAIFPGIKDLVNSLEKTYRLGIITSNYRMCVGSFLASHDLEGSFDLILTADDKRRKEDKIGMFLDNFSLKKKEIIYVGDTVSDLIACRNAGVGMIAAVWGYQKREDFEKHKPDFIAENPQDVTRILEGL